MTTILISSLAPVKSTRKFGVGILASTPAYRADHTASDAAWLAEQNAARENRHYDELAAESAALDRHERGLCC